MTATTANTRPSLLSSALAGALAGLAGGLVFGALMGMMGILPMVGMLVGQESAAVGFIVHMAISAFIGAGFGLLAARLPGNWTTMVVAGLAYGVLWWVLGALVLMPLMLGMSEMVFAVGSMQWMSLLGHLLYGLVTALVYLPIRQRL